jgi:hypothetical protein
MTREDVMRELEPSRLSGVITEPTTTTIPIVE